MFDVFYICEFADPRLNHVCVSTEKCVEFMKNIIHLPVSWFQQLKIIFHKFFMTVNFSFCCSSFLDNLLFFSFLFILVEFFCCSDLSLQHKKATYQRELMLTCRCFVMWLRGGVLRLEDESLCEWKVRDLLSCF